MLLKPYSIITITEMVFKSIYLLTMTNSYRPTVHCVTQLSEGYTERSTESEIWGK